MLATIIPWLKKNAYAALILVLVYLGGYAALYRVSDPQTLQQQADAFFSGSGRVITFDTNIERRLFPRPTIILHNLSLTETDGKTTALHIKQLRLGMAWRSIWSAPEIEKLVLNTLSGRLARHENGQWNTHDIWQLNDTSSRIPINRVIINHGHVRISTFEQDFDIQDFDFSSKRYKNGFQYYFSAHTPHALWNILKYNVQGDAIVQDNQILLPNTQVQFNGMGSSSFSGSLKTNALWTPQYFEAKESHFAFVGTPFDANINGRIDRIESRMGNARAQGIHATYHTKHEAQNLTGTLNAPQIAWQGNTINGDNIDLAVSAQNPDLSTLNITLSGGGIWQADSGLRVPQFKISGLQTTADNQTRFSTEWEGRLNLKNEQTWDIQAQGLIDRHPANLELKRANHHVNGLINMHKLDLANAWGATHIGQWHFPNMDEKLKLAVKLQLGLLKLPRVEINNLNTTLNANAHYAEFKPLSGELYGGTSSGSFRIDNASPLRFSLQQNSQNLYLQSLMHDLFGISRINGQGQTQFSLRTQGDNREEWIANLSGSLKIQVPQGQWLGINLSQLFTSALGNIPNTPENPTHTPFKQFTFESKIQSGISQHNIRASLIRPAAMLHSEGETNLNTGEIRNDILIETDNAPALPIRLSGQYSDPAITINYQRITSGNKTPEDKQKAIHDTLKQKWQWLRQEQK